MSDRDMIEHIFQGMKAEIAKMLRAHAPSRLEQFIDLAKYIEYVIDDFEVNGSTETDKSVKELSSLMKDFGAMLKDLTHSIQNANNNRYNNASFSQNRNRRFNDRTNYQNKKFNRNNGSRDGSSFNRSRSLSWNKNENFDFRRCNERPQALFQ
jgi:hypothetical protein